jgi:methionyl-tRNA formyltransferase
MEKEKRLRVVFMGTPEFAVHSLRRLAATPEIEIVAVVTSPDKPGGRGMKMQESEVKICAKELNIQVIQPVRLKDPVFIAELKDLMADLFVVVAFRMLPEVVWNMPPLGTINLHASLLPQYRGAAPINWAIINGEKISGVTTFFLKHEIDTGDLIMQKEVPIPEHCNAGTLHDLLMETGSNVLQQTVMAIAKGNAPRYPQEITPAADIKHAPKLTRENTRIQWNGSANEIVQQILGLSPYPSPWTEIVVGEGIESLRIYDARLNFREIKLEPGECVFSERKLLCGTANGNVELLTLQRQGKNKMDAASFVNGLRTDRFNLR